METFCSSEHCKHIPAYQQASKIIEKNVRKATNQCDAQKEFSTVPSGILFIFRTNIGYLTMKLPAKKRIVRFWVTDHLQRLPTSKKDLLFICGAKNVQKHLEVQVLWIGQKATIEIRQSMATGPGRSNTSTEFKDSFLRKRYESLSRRWKQTLQFKINNVISCHFH